MSNETDPRAEMIEEHVAALRQLAERADWDVLLPAAACLEALGMVVAPLEEKIRTLEAERDEARKALDDFTRMPTEDEMAALRTPESEKRMAAMRELVVRPELLDELRADRDRLAARLRIPCAGCPGCPNDCPDARDDRDRLARIVAACHEALGEDPGSDDDGLAEGIKAHVEAKRHLAREVEALKDWRRIAGDEQKARYAACVEVTEARAALASARESALEEAAALIDREMAHISRALGSAPHAIDRCEILAAIVAEIRSLQRGPSAPVGEKTEREVVGSSRTDGAPQDAQANATLRPSSSSPAHAQPSDAESVLDEAGDFDWNPAMRAAEATLREHGYEFAEIPVIRQLRAAPPAAPTRKEQVDGR